MNQKKNNSQLETVHKCPNGYIDTPKKVSNKIKKVSLIINPLYALSNSLKKISQIMVRIF